MELALIIVAAYCYVVIALRIQAVHVLQPNFIESCGMALWPIAVLMGCGILAWGRITLWRAERKARRVGRKQITPTKESVAN